METSVNNKCKAFTSLEQAKKLAEFLPIKSADMWYQRKVYYSNGYYKIDCGREHVYAEKPDYEDVSPTTPCWSLAALLGVLPDYTLQTNTDGTVFVVCAYTRQ